MWNTIKQYVMGFVSAVIALLAVYLFGRRGRSGGEDRSSQNAQNEAQTKRDKIEQLQAEKDAIEPAKPTDEDSESYWNRELDK